MFEISSYLNNEHSYIAWDTFYSGIDYYDKMLASAEVYGDFTVNIFKFENVFEQSQKFLAILYISYIKERNS